MIKRIEQRKESWKREDGYFTMEASFLITMVFLLTSVILMTGLYICDLNQAKSYLNQRVTELSLEEEEYEKERLSEDINRLRQQLFVTKITDFLIIKTEKQVSGEVSLSLKMNLPIIGDWIGKLWTDNFSLTVNVSDNVEMMRRWEQSE